MTITWMALNLRAAQSQFFRKYAFVCTIGFALFASGCATVRTSTSATDATLPATIQSALNKSKLPPSALSILVRSVPDKNARTVARDVLSVAPTRASAPASVMKLVTTYAALDLFGPTHRFRTQLITTSSTSRGAVMGDMALIGGGSVDFGPDGLAAMVAQLRLSGVEEIRGDLLLDRSLFHPERPDIGAPPFDESPEFRYNVIPDALLFGQNVVNFQLESTNDAVDVRMWPIFPNVRVDASMRLIDAPCKDWEDGWKIPRVETRDGLTQVQLSESFPKRCTQTLRLTMLDRDAHIGAAFAQAWSNAGGRWNGRVRSGALPANERRVIAEHFSRPLGEIIATANKASDNAHTRVLFLQLGVESRAPNETTARAAERALRNWLQKKGVDDSAFVFENGSGLSRSERMSASALVTLLESALKSQWSAEYLASLPIAGMDGTLRNRLTDVDVKGRARAKTGTLRDVSSIAGYVTDATGAMYIVAAFANDPKASNDVARPVVDAVVQWVATTDLSKWSVK